jgi:hypothetical protein
MIIVKVRCPHCGRTRNFSPKVEDKKKWSAQCFFCGKGFKIYPKKKAARIIQG